MPERPRAIGSLEGRARLGVDFFYEVVAALAVHGDYPDWLGDVVVGGEAEFSERGFLVDLLQGGLEGLAVSGQVVKGQVGVLGRIGLAFEGQPPAGLKFTTKCAIGSPEASATA